MTYGNPLSKDTEGKPGCEFQRKLFLIRERNDRYDEEVISASSNFLYHHLTDLLSAVKEDSRDETLAWVNIAYLPLLPSLAERFPSISENFL